jgi:hypothetical protein
VTRGITEPARRTRWTVPVTAAALTVGLLGATVAVDALRPDDPNPANHPTSTPAVPATTSAPPTVPGLPPAEAAAVIEACTSDSLSPVGPDVAVINMIDDEFGRLVLITSSSFVRACTVGSPPVPFSGVVPVTGYVDHISGAYDIDFAGGRFGDPRTEDMPASGRLGYFVAMGRLAPDVARVTVSVNSRAVDATIRNGTFIGRFLLDPGQVVDETYDLTVHAYDAAGAELPDGGPDRAWP